MSTEKQVQRMLKTLEAYTLSLEGTSRGVDGKIQLVTGSWPEIFAVDRERRCIARMPVLKNRLKEISSQHAEVKQSGWMERDGHVYMDVPLEGTITASRVKEWINEAYHLILNKLDADGRFLVLMGDRPYDEQSIINELVSFYDLKDLNQALKRISKHAILLRADKCTEKNLPVGASKIGGNPDLHPSTVWPVHSCGKPLTFLAQLNLRELQKVTSPFQQLPAQGILSIFSVWGWMTEGDADPHVPAERENPEWTQCIHTPSRKQIARRGRPRDTHGFKAAKITFIPLRSFPMHFSEPSISKLKWNKKQRERYQRFADAFLQIQLRHFCPNSHGSWHQLGGYGLFQQELPRPIESGKAELFLQLGTDNWATDMMWGDGGELSLIGQAAKLKKGSLDGLIGEIQGG